MAVAFGMGIWVAIRRAEARGWGGKFALDVSVLILIFSLLGARATYVATHWNEFRGHPLDTISPIQHTGQIGIAGLVLLGGVAAAFATVYVYARRHKKIFLAVTDLLIPPTALGIAVGRIGCFFNGCCFGLTTNAPWGVHFPAASLAASVYGADTCVHPTQLYESVFMLLTFAGLMWYDRVPKATGRVTGWFLLVYGIGRYFNEGLRWYETEMVLWHSNSARFTFSQLLSIVMVVCGATLIALSYRKRQKVNGPSTT